MRRLVHHGVRITCARTGLSGAEDCRPRADPFKRGIGLGVRRPRARLLHDHIGQFVIDEPSAALVDEDDLASQFEDA